MLKKRLVVPFVAIGLAMMASTDSASAQETPLEREVTYAEVLKDPDNVELNLMYARTQIKHGRLDKAQVALERVLIQTPDAQSVRMLYAIVLLRLDNRVEAKAVFRSLLDDELSDEDRASINDFLAAIDARDKRTHFALSVGAGMQYDDNKNSATTGGRLLFLDLEVQSDAAEQDDYSKVVSISFEGRHDLGLQRAYEVYGRVSGVGVDQNEVSELDMLYGKVDIGGSLPLEIGNVDVSINAANVRLGAVPYMRAHGLRIRWDAPQNGSIYSPYLEVSSTSQSYQDTASAATRSDQNGWSHNVSIGTIINLASDKRLDANVSYLTKTAKEKYHAYTRYGAAASYTQSYDAGIFTIARAAYSKSSYREADTFVSTKKRSDHVVRLGGTVGLPLGSIVDADLVPESARDIVLTAGIEYSKHISSLANYDYDNWNGKVMVNKKFQF